MDLSPAEGTDTVRFLLGRGMPMAAHVADGMHWGVHGVPYHTESTLSSAQVLKQVDSVQPYGAKSCAEATASGYPMRWLSEGL